MKIADFLPKYPLIRNSKLSPYGKQSFNEVVLQKKEFYDNKLSKIEEFPKEKGSLTKYQQTIARYLSSHTPYNRVLLIHAPGLGKTCSAIGAIEQIRSEMSTNVHPEEAFTGALILAKGDTLLENFKNELVHKCTRGQYIPENYNSLSEQQRIRRVDKKIRFYSFNTFAKFAKSLKALPDAEIIDKYSRIIVVIDEAHNIRIQEKDPEELEVYVQFHRFLHLIENSKVLLLTGTPMKDTVAEFASIANLLLPLTEQFPVEEKFLQEFMIETDGVYNIKPEKVNDLKTRMKGVVSFLREPASAVPKLFVGEKIGTLKEFVVYPTKMSKFQTQGYMKAYESERSGQKGIFTNSREASLFVYPNKSYGKAGFDKYVIPKKRDKKSKETSSYVLSPELKESLLENVGVRLDQGKKNEIILKNLSKFSSTYTKVITDILNTKGNCFLYSSIVKGSGCILFSLILELFGFSKSSGRESSKGLRYGLLTNSTASKREIRKINERFNREDNYSGEYIKVIIGSKAVSEGFSFNNVVFECILTPHWNYSETAQALARGIRYGSHRILLRHLGVTQPKLEVRILQPVALPNTPNGQEISVDLYMYQTSEDKDISIRRILRLLMCSAFDCALNYLQNMNPPTAKDRSRECDYLECDFKCDGVPDQIGGEYIVPEQELDYSTYQLYYSDPKLPLIKQKIEDLVRENVKIDSASIFNNLSKQFTPEEIRNALFFMEESVGEIDYSSYMSNTSIPSKMIVGKLEQLFQIYFQVDFKMIQNFVNQEESFSSFEILNVLEKIISRNLFILDKYGFPCYLREDNDIYFLVSSLTLQNTNSKMSFYSKNPCSKVDTPLEILLKQVYEMAIPNVISDLCDLSHSFKDRVKELPEEVQQLFIESAVLAEEHNVDQNKELRESILEYFQSYLRELVVENRRIRYLLFGGKVRCLEFKLGSGSKLKPRWTDCSDLNKALLEEAEVKILEEKKAENPYGIVGKYNPENQAFCLIDFQTEGNETKVDRRKVFSGKVCSSGGWKLFQLLQIAIRRLGIPPPTDFAKNVDIDKLREVCLADKEIMKIYTTEEIEELFAEELRVAVYWGTKKFGGVRGIKPVCSAIKDFLETKGFLEIDNQCGVQGKKKGVGKTQKERFYSIETRSGTEEAKLTGKKLKDILSLINSEHNLNYRGTQLQNDKLVLVYLVKKLVGVWIIDKTSIGKEQIVLVSSVVKSYKKHEIAKEVNSFANEHFVKSGRTPLIRIALSDAKRKALEDLYKEYGFSVVKKTEKEEDLQFTGK